MDKLALIKQKYGYVSAAENKYSSKPVAQKENTPIRRAQSQRKEKTLLVPQMSTERAQNTSNTKLFAQFCLPLPTKTQQNPYPSSSKREPLKQVKSNQNQKTDSRQSIIKSYEKTYDLLKNYRNRIMIDSRKDYHQSQKALILNQSKDQRQKRMEQSSLNDREQTQSFVASQVSQRMQKRAYPKRCSPLEGIDLKGSCNVYAEIDNISRLQNRIQQLVGERSMR